MKNSIQRAQGESRLSTLSGGRILRAARMNYLALLSFAAMAAGCASEEITFVNGQQKDIPVTLSVQASDLTATRAGYASGALTTGSLSLYFTTYEDDEAMEEDRYTATNEKWTYKDGTWEFESTNADGEQLIWGSDSYIGKWWAVYPYQESLNATTTTLDWTVSTTQTEDTWKNEDLLWAKNDNQTNSSVSISLTHALSKLTVNISAFGTEIETAEQTIKSLTIQGSKTRATATPSEQKWSEATGSAANIQALALATPNTVEGKQCKAGYDALLIPQTAELTIIIELNNGKVFAKNLSSQVFASGYAYAVTLQVGEDEVEAGNITTKAWGETIGGGSLETD